MVTTTVTPSGIVVGYRLNTDPSMLCASCAQPAVIVFTLLGRDARPTCHMHAKPNHREVVLYAQKNGGRMTVHEAKVEIRLKAPLGTYMDARGMSVRDLQYKVSDRKRSWSHGTIGHLRKHTDRSVDPELARRIVKALDVPYSVLFVERVSNVTREVNGNARRAA